MPKSCPSSCHESQGGVSIVFQEQSHSGAGVSPVGDGGPSATGTWPVPLMNAPQGGNAWQRFHSTHRAPIAGIHW